MYYNIHTHHAICDEGVCEIVNLREPDPALVKDMPHTWYSAGIHPWRVGSHNPEEELATLGQLCRHPSVVAIGECGLDKVCKTPMEWQKKTFEAQITLSEEVAKPLIVHCVKAVEEILYYKKRMQPVQAWVMHGFRGKRQEAESLIKKGFYLSIGAMFHEDALKAIPPNRLLLETDDSDRSIREVYGKVSAVLTIAETELLKQVEENVAMLFYSLKKNNFVTQNILKR